MDELIELDSTFTESGFKTKVDNIFVMLHMALMTDNLKRVKHFVSADVYDTYSDRLRVLNQNNERQMFDELNVKSTNIINVEITDEKYIVTVKIISRYLDYVVDKDTNKFIRGNNSSRVEKENILVFEKKRNAVKQGIVRFCPNCGHPMDINKTGYCEYCHSTYDQENYDYVLVRISTY